MVPALVGLILTFIGTIITSIGLVKERQTGTLEQLAVMPLRPSDVIVGKIAPYFILAGVDMLVVTAAWRLDIHVPFNGNPFLFALGAAIFLFVVLGLGVLISTLSQTQAQAIQLAIMILLPQILLQRIHLPAQRDAGGDRVDRLLPAPDVLCADLAGDHAARRGFDSLWPAYVVLTVMAAVVFTGATLRFRRDLAPGAGHARGRRGGQRPEEPEAVSAAGPVARDIRRHVGAGPVRRSDRSGRRHGTADARVGDRGRGRRRRGQDDPDAGPRTTIGAGRRHGECAREARDRLPPGVIRELGGADRDPEHRLHGRRFWARRRAPRVATQRASRGRGADGGRAPPRIRTVRRDASQARLLHGDGPPAVAAGPRRAEHRHRPREPDRPMAVDLRGRRRWRRRRHVHHVPRRSRAGRAAARARPRSRPAAGVVRRRAGRLRRDDHPRPLRRTPEWSWRRGRELQEYWPASDQPEDRTVVDPDLEDLVVALSLAARNQEEASA